MVRPAGLEPATTRLEGGCSIQLSYGRVLVLYNVFNVILKNGRSGGIRTPDILLPKQARYRTALHSEYLPCSAFQVVRMISTPPKFVNEKIYKIQLILRFRCFLSKLTGS